MSDLTILIILIYTLFNTNIQNLNTLYVLATELQTFLGDNKDVNISILHLRIRCINKKFENFKIFYHI